MTNVEILRELYKAVLGDKGLAHWMNFLVNDISVNGDEGEIKGIQAVLRDSHDRVAKLEKLTEGMRAEYDLRQAKRAYWKTHLKGHPYQAKVMAVLMDKKVLVAIVTAAASYLGIRLL